MPPSETIDTALDAFPHEQRLRPSERTYRNREAVIRLLRDSDQARGRIAMTPSRR